MPASELTSREAFEANVRATHKEVLRRIPSDPSLVGLEDINVWRSVCEAAVENVEGVELTK